MRFSLTRRIFSLVSASWLVLLLAEPPALHVCAVHGTSAEQAPATHSHQHAPTHEHSAQCSCLGTSSHSTNVVIPAVVETAFVEAPIAVATLLPVPEAPAPLFGSDFFHPYPNGPPLTIAA